MLTVRHFQKTIRRAAVDPKITLHRPQFVEWLILVIFYVFEVAESEYEVNCQQLVENLQQLNFRQEREKKFNRFFDFNSLCIFGRCWYFFQNILLHELSILLKMKPPRKV